MILLVGMTFSGLSGPWFDYLSEASEVILGICVISYLMHPTKRFKSLLTWIILYRIYVHTVSMFFYEVDQLVLMFEYIVFFSGYIWLLRRPQLKTPRGVNPDNILLAFYTGDHGSPFMQFFGLFDMPPTTMSIVAGNYNLRPTKGGGTFEFRKCGDYYIHSPDHYVVDTGVKYSENFLAKMEKCAKIKTAKFGLRTQCIEGVEDLLGDIGEEWRPIKKRGEMSPSKFFRKAIRL